MKDNIAVISNNIGRGIKVGSSSTKGIYIGNTLITDNKFDISQLLNNITIPDDYNNVSEYVQRALIVNLSDSSETVLYRDDIQTKIPAQHIEWYSYNNLNSKSIAYYNEGNADLRYLFQHIEIGRNFVTSYVDSTCSNGDSMFDIYDAALQTTFNIVCIVMNA